MSNGGDGFTSVENGKLKHMQELSEKYLKLIEKQPTPEELEQVYGIIKIALNYCDPMAKESLIPALEILKPYRSTK